MSIEAPIAVSERWVIGEDRIWQYTIKDANNAAQNITGWALKWEMRADVGQSTALLSKTTSAGITITDPSNGVCEVKIDRADTIDNLGAVQIQPGRYVYSLHRTDSGAATELAYGDAVLLEAASR